MGMADPALVDPHVGLQQAFGGEERHLRAGDRAHQAVGLGEVGNPCGSKARASIDDVREATGNSGRLARELAAQG